MRRYDDGTSQSALDVDTSGVPFAITNRRLIPAQRYYDKDFFELEKREALAARLAERLSPRGDPERRRLRGVLGGRPVGDRRPHERNGDQGVPERVPAPGDAAGAVGCGTFRGGQIVCPFHGWRWNLDGTSSFVFGRDSFPPECVTDADLHLVECQVDTWANCVFINMDPDAPPLQQQLAPMPSLLDPLNVGLMRVVLVEGREAEGELEAGHGGVHGRLPRSADPSPAHLRGRCGGFVADEHSNDGICYFSHANGHAHFQASVPSDDPTKTRTGRRAARSSWPMRRPRCPNARLRT